MVFESLHGWCLVTPLHRRCSIVVSLVVLYTTNAVRVARVVGLVDLFLIKCTLRVGSFLLLCALAQQV